MVACSQRLDLAILEVFSNLNLRVITPGGVQEKADIALSEPGAMQSKVGLNSLGSLSNLNGSMRLFTWHFI